MLVIETESLDLSAVDTIVADALLILEGSASDLLVDMSRVTFMDSSGLGILVSVAKILKARDGRLRLTGASAQVRRVLELAGLEDVFPVLD